MQGRLTGVRWTVLVRSLQAGLIASALWACSPSQTPPWTEAEMKELLEYFGEVGEAYALVDMCIPMIEADEDAKYQLVTAIKADRYAKIKQLDTQRELTRLLAHFRGRGGSSQQNLALRLHYEEAYRQAEDDISSVQVCVDTMKDYANTIINMRVQ